MDWVDAAQALLGFRVERKAAPRPVLRVGDQATFHWIHVHVVEFFNSLFQTPHVEIKKPFHCLIVSAVMPSHLAWTDVALAAAGTGRDET